MADITFKCSGCGQQLTVEATAAGQTATCPQCGKALVVPPPTLPPALAGSAPQLRPGAPGKSGMAVTSLVLGILGLVSCILGPLFAIPAIICGHVARNRALTQPAQYKGREMALAGLIMGYVGLAMLLVVGPILAGMLLPALASAREKARQINCSANLKSIGLACNMYAADNRGVFPPDFQALVGGKYLDAFKMYTCPSTQTRPAQSATQFASGANCDYVYFAAGLTEDNTQNAGATLLAADKPGNHRRSWNIAFADGHVENVRGDDFNAIVRQREWTVPDARTLPTPPRGPVELR